ncbi:helix-turn-helix domain-containing protein [Longirhabdus pacifica]|uniref:helix-turn-helix domain-containing protein n=1 Tax=Longirhabdus pacifica TaxID=2305227 RepID=UPI001008C69D|nr:helix-turn-helix transcriptional regulator [Longirhabdus pacifica]
MTSFTYTTIGEVIRRERHAAGLTLDQLGDIVGTRKGVIGKIETGDTKKPEFKTLLPIAKVLNIPLEQIIDHYLDLELRPEVLEGLLQESIKSHPILIHKAAEKILENPRLDTYSALEQLYNITIKVEDKSIQLKLFEYIVEYARTRGVPEYTAKSLLQIYLIKRQDFKQMEASYQEGKEIMHYINFLSDTNKVTFYFKMALQSFTIKKYKECIHFCEKGLNIASKDTELKANVHLALVNCYYYLEDFKEAEREMKNIKYPYTFLDEALKLTQALIEKKKGNFSAALPMLQQCLEQLSAKQKITAVNALLDMYKKSDDLEAMEPLFKKGKQFLSPLSNHNTPYKYISVGKYYQHRGYYYLQQGQHDKGIKDYTESMQWYNAVSAFEEIISAYNEIFTSFVNQSKGLDFHHILQLTEVYNNMLLDKE